MEIYNVLYDHYKNQAELLLKNERINNPTMEQIQAYIIKCCVFEMLLKKDSLQK